MPQANDLVVQNAAGANKTFTLLAPAAGFGGVAEWALKEGLVATVFPRMTVGAVKTANGSNRATFKFKMPSSYVDASTGLTRAGTSFEANVSVTVPDAFPEALRADAIAYLKNAVGTALIQAVFKDGLPAT